MHKKKIKDTLNLTSGSTRMVFFFGKYAVKMPRLDLGISGIKIGIESNQEECIKYTKALDRNDIIVLDKLCPIHYAFFCGFFIVMQKADRHLTEFEWKRYEKVLKAEKYWKWFNDVTPKNAMMLNNKVVMVDYAYHPKAK